MRSDEPHLFLRAGFETVDDLWTAVGKDADHGIDAVAEATGIDPARLVDLLTNDGEDRAGRRGRWLERNWLEVAAAIGLVLLAVLAVRALGS